MKIAYLISHDIKTNDGVTKKINSQIKHWKLLGHEVTVFCTIKQKGESLLIANQYKYNNYFTLRLLKNIKLIRDLDEFCPDIIYYRYDTWSSTLACLQKKYSTITELNTLDLSEFRLLIKSEKTIKSVARYISYTALRSLVIKNSTALIGVTNEIARHQSILKYNQRTFTIPNSIDLHEFKPIKPHSLQSERIGLFFIGTPGQPWQGVDIIENLSRELPDFDFHIVGVSKQSKNNVFYYGYLSREEYIPILKKCSICIGTLALFRKKMEEASPLKVREYLAYGYPVIIGYRDTAYLSNNAPFLHFIDAQSISKTKIEKLRKFIYSNKNTVVNHDQLSSINAANIEKERVNLFSHLIINRPT